jgi:hypothetical protein
VRKIVRIILTISFFSMALVKTHSYSQTSISKKNLIKIGAAQIFVGEVNFCYERLLFKKLSAEIASGFVTDNYLLNFISETKTGNTGKTLIGPSFGAMLKYYPFITGDEVYVCLDFKYRRYRKQYTQDGGAYSFNEYVERYIPRVGIGYHFFLDENLFFDFSGNLGLIFQNSLQFNNNQVDKAIKLNFGLGLKFGYAF